MAFSSIFAAAHRRPSIGIKISSPGLQAKGNPCYSPLANLSMLGLEKLLRRARHEKLID